MLSRLAFEELDDQDSLASFRDEFCLPENLIYLDGNSLGAVPRNTLPRISEVIEKQWGEGLIRSWTDSGWLNLPITLGNKIAGLIGATSGEVAVCDSTSVNLFKVLCAASSIAPSRSVLLTDNTNFPTDIYMAEGLSSLSSRELEIKVTGPNQLEAALDSSVAVLFLTHVDFRTGSRYDMHHISKLARRLGIILVWDLSHSAGVMPLYLNESGADFAVGCGYKYLNGGPGSPGYVYVARRWQNKINTPLRGWMGHATPFDFSLDYVPASGIRQMLCGSPPILSMTALDVAVDILTRVDLQEARKKSVRMTTLFMELLEEYVGEYDVSVLTPADEQDRGGQVSISHPSASHIVELVGKQGLVADFRPPELVRFGFSPLYTKYVDVWDAANIFVKALKTLR